MYVYTYRIKLLQLNSDIIRRIDSALTIVIFFTYIYQVKRISPENPANRQLHTKFSSSSNPLTAWISTI